MTLRGISRYLFGAATLLAICLLLPSSGVAQGRLVEVREVRADPVIYFAEPAGAPAGTIPRNAIGDRLEVLDQHDNRRFQVTIEGYGTVWIDPRQVQLDEDLTRRVLCDRLATGNLSHGVRMASRFNCAN